MSIGYIKLHRSLIEWQYWDDHNTTRLLIYFLVSVNYESKRWKGIDINCGSMVTSFDKISIATGLSVKQVRRSIKILIDCKEVTQVTTNKFQLITLVKWAELQVEENKRATKGQTKDNQREGQRATTKEVKEEKNNIQIENFLNWFNESIEKKTGKKGKFKILSKTDESNFKKIRASYEFQDFVIAFNSFWVNQWAIETNNRTPSHFLRVDNFNKYLNQISGSNTAPRLTMITIADHD